MVFNDAKTRNAVKRRFERAQAHAWVFLCVFAVALEAAVSAWSGDVNTSAYAGTAQFVEEMSRGEKEALIQSLLKEGDDYAAEQKYEQANAAYELIFMLDPEHLIASERIDRLKKRLLEEGKFETNVLDRVYDSEIELRTRYYWNRAQELVRQERWHEARFTVEKLLLINPLHEEARTLYEELKRR